MWAMVEGVLLGRLRKDDRQQMIDKVTRGARGTIILVLRGKRKNSEKTHTWFRSPSLLETARLPRQ